LKTQKNNKTANKFKFMEIVLTLVRYFNYIIAYGNKLTKLIKSGHNYGTNGTSY
jgi:hypothetical protein